MPNMTNPAPSTHTAPATATGPQTYEPQTYEPQTYDVRTATEADWDTLWTLDEHAFSFRASQEIREAERATFELDRTLLACDGDQPVGVAAAYSLTMTLPGGPRPVAGVTWVSVLPTHRRRGVLTTLMRAQLHGLHEQGREAVAALWASESAIYGRFGYGLASEHLALSIPRSPAALLPAARVAADGAGLRLRFVDVAESLDLVEPVYDAMAAARPGVPARPDAWRRRMIFDPESERRGATPLRCVVAEDAEGAVRGYARFATADEWDEAGPKGTVRVREVEARDSAAYASLWRFLLDLDLMRTVAVRNRPLDDPLIHLLADARAGRPALRDGLFVRLVDVERALSERAYGSPVDVVLEVADPFCPWNAGRWRLEGDTDGGRCARTDADAELVLSSTELGAAHLGGTTLAALARAGRVQEVRPGALAEASRAWRADVAPWCPFVF